MLAAEQRYMVWESGPLGLGGWREVSTSSSRQPRGAPPKKPNVNTESLELQLDSGLQLPFPFAPGCKAVMQIPNVYGSRGCWQLGLLGLAWSENSCTPGEGPARGAGVAPPAPGTRLGI